MIHIGDHPKTGLPVYVVRSPFGPYIQCGDASNDNPNPEGCWIPPCCDVSDITLDMAVELLTFPRNLGIHPITGGHVVLKLHQSGPSLHYSKTNDTGREMFAVCQISRHVDVFTFTFDQAMKYINRMNENRRDSDSDEE